MDRIANSFYRFSVFFSRLVYLNFLWIIFSLLGFIVLGFFPSTIAMFTVIRKLIREEETGSIFRLFWETFKKEFWKANGIGWILLLGGYFISLEYYLVRMLSAGVSYYFARAGVFFQIILYSLIAIYIFPIYVHFHLKLKDYFKWAFVIGISHPLLSI